MNNKDKLKKLAAAESAFNEANNAQGAAWEVYTAAKKVYGDPRAAAWDAYTAAEKVYGDARAASKFINDARDAARSDFVAAAVALDYANKVVKDAAKEVINKTRETR